MKALLVSVVSAAVAGVGAGGFMNLSDDVLKVEPTAQATVRQATLTEDPGVALHRAAMGSDAWTAPLPVTPANYVAANAPDLAAIESELAAVGAEARQKGVAARNAYARLFGEDVDEPAPAAPDVAAISLER